MFLIGKLIVIDGLDGCGKSTQAQLLCDTLKKEYDKVILISYPDYTKPSSTMVKMYLNGDFSQDPNAVNAYAASTFYAVDRYASFMQYWGKLYLEGYIIIASRYVSSNAIHQMVKLNPTEWDYFLDWLSDYEYNKLALPRPDKIIFLDMPRELANSLIMSRYDGDEDKKDIHEKDISYLENCQKSAHYVAKKENWSLISCAENNQLNSIEKIAQEILKKVKEVL